MTVENIVLLGFMTFYSAGISALVWGTYRRLEHRIDRLEERNDSQIASVRSDLTQIALAVNAPRAAKG